jgi:hypothetical protein
MPLSTPLVRSMGMRSIRLDAAHLNRMQSTQFKQHPIRMDRIIHGSSTLNNVRHSDRDHQL